MSGRMGRLETTQIEHADFLKAIKDYANSLSQITQTVFDICVICE